MGSIRNATAVVIPAAGSGTRLGAATAKAFVGIDGVPMFIHAVRAFADCGAIVVAAPAADVSTAQTWLAQNSLPQVTVVAGGDTRSQSIEKALEAVPADAQYVLVHDAARPLVPSDVVGRVLDALGAGADAVVPVLPVTDSLKRVTGQVITEHINRAEFARAQTPQGFRKSVLQAAYAAAHQAGTLASATVTTSIPACATTEASSVAEAKVPA